MAMGRPMRKPKKVNLPDVIKGRKMIVGVERIRGAAEREEIAGMCAGDYLAWAREELVRMYEDTKQELEEADEGTVWIKETLVKIMTALAKNLESTAKVAAVLQMKKMSSYKEDPEFQALWQVLTEIVHRNPELAKELEKALAMMEGARV